MASAAVLVATHVVDKSNTPIAPILMIVFENNILQFGCTIVISKERISR